MIRHDRTIMLIGLAGLVLAVMFSVASVTAGLGNRWGLWDFRTGITLFRWTAYGELLSAAICLTGFILALIKHSKKALIYSAAGLVISIMALSAPVSMWLTARSVPPIHDISTDTETPPQFTMLMKLRKETDNPLEYGGPGIAKLQHEAYPDIQPLMLEVSPAMAFERALSVAQGMRWKINHYSLEDGFIEATDTTFWFGFKDDIVVRIAPHDSGSRIDVRSVSRVGKSDLGANAKRIRAFFKKIKGA